MLFVEPGQQERGLGRRLLEKVLAGSDDAMHATCTDSVQPVSNALYSRFGMVPRVPVLELVGRMEHPIPGGRGSCRAVRPAPRGADRRRGADAPGRGA